MYIGRQACRLASIRERESRRIISEKHGERKRNSRGLFIYAESLVSVNAEERRAIENTETEEKNNSLL